jgi:hypothetical protein
MIYDRLDLDEKARGEEDAMKKKLGPARLPQSATAVLATLPK